MTTSEPLARRSRARLGAALAAAAVAAAACGPDSARGSDFEPTVPDTLTVATAFLELPGFWEGPDAGAEGGFESALAVELADELDLAEVEVVEVPFADIVAGDLGGADVAISQVTPTQERDRVADFTTPYLSAPPGVLVRVDAEARDTHELQQLRWVVVGVSTLADVVRERIRPDEEPVEVATRGDAVELLIHGEADAVLLDLPVALGVASEWPTHLTVSGHLGDGEGLAVVLPESSPNAQVVDSAVRALLGDGTIDALAERWLGDDSSIPLIRVAD